jgi:hypothetical protein
MQSVNTIKEHIHAFILRLPLGPPTRVSPPAATEQKQHYENNQYGFHVGTSLVRGSWTGLCNGRLASSLNNIIEVAKKDVCSHWTTIRILKNYSPNHRETDKKKACVENGGALILDPKSSRLSRCVRIVIAKHSPFAILETGL